MATVPTSSARPRTVTLFGLLNILVGLLGILMAAVGYATAFAARAALRGPGPVAFQQKPLYVAWIVTTTVIDMALAGLLIAAGAGLLKRRPWGRRWSMIYAVVALGWAVVLLVPDILFITGPLAETLRARPGPEANDMAARAVSGLISDCFGFVYPTLLLVFMTRPGVVNALRPDTRPKP